VYALVSARFTVGPPWLMLGVLAAGISVMLILRRRGRHREPRIVALGLMVLVTIAIASSAAFLLAALLYRGAQAQELLVSAALLWLSNLLAFALWYWELDGGGPHYRRRGPDVSSDFYFPQMVAGGERVADWSPEFLDYLFLAFNTSTAFSPTDTMVLARRAKVLMMLQSVISLTTIVVFAGRAINTL
jgi:Protein of unknown function (DUF1345)